MRLSLASRIGVAFLFVVIAACGSNPDGNGDDQGDGGASGDGGPCQGLACYQVDCPGGGTTSVSGTVYAPNGTLPLYNVVVYVPGGTVGPLSDELTCDRCGGVLSGSPLVQTTTDTLGRFVLPDMPATDALGGLPGIPLVIQVGKWRRQIVVPTVTSCTDTALAPAETRLPANQGEGDIPQMALTTGSADALECLLRKIGLDDSEFTAAGGTGRVHLYTGNGTDAFDGANGGGAFTNATTLWDDTASLSEYDVVMLSCEGNQNVDTKLLPSRQALKEYADLGGRVFASHWHNYWIQAGPAPWDALATWNFQDDLGSVTASVDTAFERGNALADWLFGPEVVASTVRGEIAIEDTQHTTTGVTTDADRWIYQDDTANGTPAVQYFSYTTPLEAGTADRCGRVVYSDIHVSSTDDSASDLAFPSGGCITSVDVMTPQEKVLAFMIFDIASCVGPDVE